MLLKITRFANLSLMGLGTGISFSHFLQWRRKAELPGEVFVRVQKTLREHTRRALQCARARGGPDRTEQRHEQRAACRSFGGLSAHGAARRSHTEHSRGHRESRSGCGVPFSGRNATMRTESANLLRAFSVPSSGWPSHRGMVRASHGW